jgi:hypothetical protein
MKAYCTIAVLAIAILAGTSTGGTEILLEAEGFDELGGWKLDQQFMDQMGSPILLAHGMGVPVKDATTAVTFPTAGTYHLWVRTRDWVANFSAKGAPGKFHVLIDGKPVEKVFGTEGAKWHWQRGGAVRIDKPKATVSLHDLTGFDGRCDAIVFSADADFVPPADPKLMAPWRRNLLGLSDKPSDAGKFDLVVIGGGLAGCCTAVSAARLGLRVALIQNRPVLGGNNSSEVRVGLSGLIHQEPYRRLGDLVDEIGPVGHWNLWEARKDPNSPRSKRILAEIEKNPEKKTHNAGSPTNYADQKKVSVVRAEKNISLFLNTHANAVAGDRKRIASVIAQNIRTGKRLRFSAPLFVDCTGDGTVGFLAGADFRVGREAQSQTGEKLAPKKADQLVMGTSVQWYSAEQDKTSAFPECPWAVQFNDKSCTKSTRGDWNWETGANRDQIAEIERIRDYALRVTYGNWSFLKNRSRFKKQYAKRRLVWVAYIGGKRESRRLLGDVILRQQDIVDQRKFPDACVTTTWSIDLHYPKKTAGYDGEPFRSTARHLRIKPYQIPYRCLYSRNVDNLMMAGRNISVTHVALGTVRVQRTTGMMGEVVGMAAALCKKYSTTPRGVYKDYLEDLKKLMHAGAGKAAARASTPPK